MIKIEGDKHDVLGLSYAVRGMRNPKNSWDKSDSDYELVELNDYEYHIGDNDLKLMETLTNAGTDHRKYLRMIVVYLDITAPLYWWKEFDTYKVGTVANSCSTMHKITSKEFTRDDFSHEHLIMDGGSGKIFDDVISGLNYYRKRYLETNDKEYWWQLIQLLPSSYNQKRTVMLNYEVLNNICHSRRNHKLDEWRDFCKVVALEMPYAKQLIFNGLTKEQFNEVINFESKQTSNNS